MAQRTKTSEVVAQLKTIFQKHIGEKNSIASEDVYELLFGAIETHNYFQSSYYRQLMGAGISKLRKETNLFVVHQRLDKKLHYFVVTNHAEAQHYLNSCADHIKGVKNMMKRCERAVDEQWCQLPRDKITGLES